MAGVKAHEQDNNGGRFNNVPKHIAPHWVASKPDLLDRWKLALDMPTDGFLPRSISNLDLAAPVGRGTCKSAQWIGLAGPIGKALLAGLLPDYDDRQVERALMAYLDVISEFWEYQMTVKQARELQMRTKEVLCRLEMHLPAFELNLNRHLMLHLAEGVLRFGPPFAWSMFSDERFWNALTKMLHNVARPSASILANWKSLQVAFRAAQELQIKCRLSIRLLADEDSSDEDPELDFEDHSDPQKASWSLGGEVKAAAINLGRRSQGAAYAYRVQVHRCLLEHPHLCRACEHVDSPTQATRPDICRIQSCPTYRSLWDDYVGARNPTTNKEWEDLLNGWKAWAEETGLEPRLVSLCKGPTGKMRMFKTADYGPAHFCTFASCKTLKTRPCVVMMKHEGEGGERVASFGQVQQFLLAPAPGSEEAYRPAEQSDKWACFMVRAMWYKPYRGREECVDPLSGLRLVKPELTDYNKYGDIWPLGTVAPVEVGLLPHWSKKNCLVAVSRRSTFAESP